MRKSNSLWKVAAIALFLYSPFQAVAGIERENICERNEYLVGFFNGVWNTRSEAVIARKSLSTMLGKTHKSKPFTTELFYNTSGIEASSRWNAGWRDIAEVFEQRSRELDGVLADRWEFFWEVLNGDATLWDRLATSVVGAAALRQSIEQAIQGKTMQVLTGLASTPMTAGDYAVHETRITALTTERKKLLLIGHSQGNLFVNHAYRVARQHVPETSVKTVHIAPASPTLNGPHILADIDVVINGIRLVSGAVPPVTTAMPLALRRDWSGHMLAETYLDPGRPARQIIQNLLTSSLDDLKVPPTQGHAGMFTVTLTWDGPGDVDLHTFEPNGSHVYFSQMQGTAGYLDVDNTTANGPEHYYASCDAPVLTTGTYRIGVLNYARADGRIATVQVASHHDGELLTRRLDVGPQGGINGSGAPVPVFDVIVAKDDRGRYSVTAQ